ncbi:MAG: DUF5054 domain-containing protein [Lentisphaerota bacterium]
MRKRTVHLVFKTHLDIGFTDLSANVIKRYFDEFIPKAMLLADEMRKKESSDRFIWTTGSWLIYEYLHKAPPDMKKKMEKAILSGDITWHAIPFTTHTELMDKSLFRAGLYLSQELDRMFGKKTIAAKMTDVPGHCRAIIPLLAEAGIKFLHIGVNDASKLVDIPPLFIWQHPDGSEVVVNYVSGYGKPAEVEGLEDILAFAHSNDNCGPPSSVKELEGIFAKYRAEYKGAQVQASKLDNFAENLILIKDKLPVVTSELGDTWIHGAGTDPVKVAHFRQLCRLRNKWALEYKLDMKNPEYNEFTRKLMLIPEHTWGMDLKTHLRDYVNYGIKEFTKARSKNIFDTNLNDKAVFNNLSEKKICKIPHPENAKTTTDYSLFESSWKEQRSYITESIDCLKSAKLKKEALDVLKEVEPSKPSLKDYCKIKNVGVIQTELFTILFNDKTGSIKSLKDKSTGKEWCSKNIGLFRHEIFSAECYKNFHKKYNINHKVTDFWSIPDFTKPGLDRVKNLKHEFFSPSVKAIYKKESSESHSILFNLTMPEKSIKSYGSPSEVLIEYSFTDKREIGIELQWFGKKANRIPEAFWFSFNLNAKESKKWSINKMGEPISPLDVAKKGNRALHALWSSVLYNGNDGNIEVESLDAPLVSPGRPRILEFDTSQPKLNEGFHFNLFNNLWGTNFPMWFEDDAKFRFKLSFPAGT